MLVALSSSLLLLFLISLLTFVAVVVDVVGMIVVCGGIAVVVMVITTTWTWLNSLHPFSFQSKLEEESYQGNDFFILGKDFESSVDQVLFLENFFQVLNYSNRWPENLFNALLENVLASRRLEKIFGISLNKKDFLNLNYLQDV